jgi:hypothetical protein
MGEPQRNSNPPSDQGGGTGSDRDGGPPTGEPAMSWTQPAGQGAGQAQLNLGAFEAAPAREAQPTPPPHAPTPPPVSSTPPPVTAKPPAAEPAPAAPPATAPQVVWSSAPEPTSWHSDVRHDE